MSSPYTPKSEIASIVTAVRNGFNQGITKDLSWRKQQIHQFIKFCTEKKDDILDAINKDLAMDPLCASSEINLATKEAEMILENIDEWVKPEKRPVPLVQFPSHGVIIREPYGVILNVSPWNYPFGLAVRPLIEMIAAGNAVILKPSEVSANVSELFAKHIPKYLDQRVIRVITGGVEETTEVLRQKFDLIMYTGNGVVAKIIMKAAAENLTPVLLELGGKSPCIVDDSVDVKNAVKRICWGKFINVGQTCIAPDYALVHKDVYDQFLNEFKATVKEFFGEDPRQSKDYSRIISPRHAKRILELLKGKNIYNNNKYLGADIFIGGKGNPDDRYIEPTVVINPDLNGKLMQEEIFGPILPVVKISSLDEAIKLVNSKDKPLAAYIFSKKQSNIDRFLQEVPAGGGGVNEVIMHASIPTIPFGGVGPSGMGRYYGKYGFDAFTNPKGFLVKKLSADPALRFPPYTDNKIVWLNRLNKIKLPKINIYALLVPIIAVAIAYVVSPESFAFLRK